MYQSEREIEIQRILSQQNYATVKDLSRLLFTSEASIRRSLTVLEQRGIVRRSYGGVELLNGGNGIQPFTTRIHHNIPAKKEMARKAALLVKQGDIIFLDQSSSAFFVANELKRRSDITVVTNNIEIVTLLSQTNMEVVCSGGRLSSNNRNCLMGEDAYHAFEMVHADIVFFSCNALSSNGIIYDCCREEVCIRNVMLQNADMKCFLCASEKKGKKAGYIQCSLEEVTCLISEEK